MRLVHPRPAVLAVLLVAATACAALGGRRAESAAPPTTVLVTNDDFLDMVVYIVASGQRTRLGEAISNRTTTFTLPTRFVAAGTPISFQLDPVGARARPRTEEILVVAGDELLLRVSSIQTSLSRSSP